MTNSAKPGITKVIVIGGGGHAKSTIDVILSNKHYEIIGILDNQLSLNEKILGLPVIGNDDDIERLINEGNINFVLGIGFLGKGCVREKLFDKIKKAGGIFPVIQSSFSVVSPFAIIDEATVIYHNAVVNAGAQIGKGCIINTSCIIEHDAHIGNFSHVSTHATINGDVALGSECFIGSNAVINHGLSIASNSIVGSGAVINKSITQGIWVGIPAKKL